MAGASVGNITASVVGESAKSRLRQLHLLWQIDNWQEVQAAVKPSYPHLPDYSQSIFEMSSPKVSSEQLGSSSKGSWQIQIRWRKEANRVLHIVFFVGLIYDDANAAKQREMACALVSARILAPSPRSESYVVEQDGLLTWTNTTDTFFCIDDVVSDFNTVRQILEAGSLLVELTLTFCECPYRETFTALPWSKPDMSSGMLSLYKSQTLTDFVLVSSDNKELHVHRSVLAVSCEAFKAMLTNDTKEKRTGRCELADIDYETLEVVVDSFYGGDILPRVLQDPAAVYRAADKYSLGELKDFCRLPLQSTLTVKNVVDRYLFGQQFELTDLIKKTVGFVRTHYDEFVDNGGVVEVCEKIPDAHREFFKMVGAGKEPTSTPVKRQRTK